MQDLVGKVVKALQKFNVAFGFRDRRWRHEYSVSFGGSGLVISASADGDANGCCQIPLRFAEVTHFQTRAGTLFMLIGQRKISERPGIEDLNRPFEEYWVVGVSSSDADSLQSNGALPNMLTTMGLRGAVRSDLCESYDIGHDAIGSGACSSVHLGRARYPAISKTKEIAKPDDGVVAVKILTAESSYQAAKEAGFFISLTPHRNIVGFHGLFKVPEPASDRLWRWAILMEYCPRGDLHEFLQAKGPCSEQGAAEIMFGLLSALSHIHSHGIVHRDVKSENILLDRGRPVLADFGIAAYLDDAQAMAKTCGSPGYCAPEVLDSQPYNAKVDVFSSGVILYFLLSGTLPFRGQDIPSVLRRTARCKVRMDEGPFQLVSSKVKSLIEVFLKRCPEERPESSEALQRVIMAYITHLRASSLLPSCITDAPEPAEKMFTCADGTKMMFRTQTSTRASWLDTEDCLGQPTFSSRGSFACQPSGYAHTSEASSHNDIEDDFTKRGSFSSFRSTFTPRGTDYTQTSEDPLLSHCEDLIMADDLATRVMQGQVLNTRHQCSNESGHRSKSVSSETSVRPAMGKGAGLFRGLEDLGVAWSSEGPDAPKRPTVGHNFGRQFPLSSVASDGKRPRTANTSPNNAIGLDHHADGDSSTPSSSWMPHSPPPNGKMRANRRLMPFFKRRQNIAKYEQTNTFVADKQGNGVSSCGNKVTKEELSAASESERPSEARYSTVSSCRPTGRFSNSGFHDDGGAHPSFDNDIHGDSINQEMPRGSLVNQLPNLFPNVDGACSKLNFQKPSKPSLPRGARGWWQRTALKKTGNP